MYRSILEESGERFILRIAMHTQGQTYGVGELKFAAS
jgi:hypothetical protein